MLDNLETLLTNSDHWRDPLWGEVVAAFLSHGGSSRVVLTSRRVPADLADHAKVQSEAIHALSLPESVLLARELPNLKALFDDEAGRALLRHTLWVVQGHPKLLELAGGLAADRNALAARVAAAADEVRDRADILDTFFAAGVAREGESRQGDDDFVRALRGWTMGIASTLAPTARLLLTFLCRLEPADRNQGLVKTAWPRFLTPRAREIPPRRRCWPSPRTVYRPRSPRCDAGWWKWSILSSTRSRSRARRRCERIRPFRAGNSPREHPTGQSPPAQLWPRPTRFTPA